VDWRRKRAAVVAGGVRGAGTKGNQRVRESSLGLTPGRPSRQGIKPAAIHRGPSSLLIAGTEPNVTQHLHGPAGPADSVPAVAQTEGTPLKRVS
jgi:hypothetical protein